MLGNHKQTIDIIVEVSFIIGDIQGEDKIRGSAASYSDKLKRLCRKCDVSGRESDNPFVECRKLEMQPIIDLVVNEDKRSLKELNQYQVYSAFFHLGYGGCPFGIFSAACPIEPLHSLENGLMNDMLNILFNYKLEPRQRAEFDQIVIKFCKQPRQHFISSNPNKELP